MENYNLNSSDRRKQYYAKKQIPKLRESLHKLYNERYEANIELNKAHKKTDRFTKLSFLAIKLVPIIVIGFSIGAWFYLPSFFWIVLLFSIIILIGVIIFAFLFLAATGVSDHVSSNEYEDIYQIDRKIKQIESKIEELKKDLDDPSI